MELSEVVIVLSRPAEPGNVGAVCRAMKNMGLRRLRLTAPCFPALGEAGGAEAVIRARAVHAADVWDQAETFDCLAAAVDGCPLVIGTTRRRGRHRKQVTLTPWETAAFLKAHPGPGALVFGSERTGLEAGELELCNLASHIPAAGECPSLNLSHAVQIYAYELFRICAGMPRQGLFPEESLPAKGRWVPMDQVKINLLVRELTDKLETLGFYKKPGREEQEFFFRDLISRAGLNEREGRYLAGVIAKAVRLGGNPAGPPEIR
jgi:tRNA/rRNA methyltransferase/tRNA (cytidine32/uridine32-2'-O)-methyltransferase